MSNENQIFIVCGETSSDEHMSEVLKALKQALPDLSFFGMGGGNLEAGGMELIVDSRTTGSVMGITEVFGHLGTLYRAFHKLLLEVDRRQPKVAVLVDFPDFNLRMAEKLTSRGIKVVYFISPQLWAWRRGRIKLMKKYVDKIIPIFPFEEDFYKSFGMDVSYVGHPFKDKEPAKINKEDFLKRNEIYYGEHESIIAFLPGSRKAEVKKILPVMAETATRLTKNHANLKCIVPVAPSVKLLVEEMKNSMPDLNFIDGQARELLKNADAAAVASGTATIEAVLAKVPFCICYKVSSLTYTIGKLLIRGVKFIGMPNLIADREVVKEFIQYNYTTDNLTEEMEKLLFDLTYRSQIEKDLEEVDDRLQVKSKDSSIQNKNLTVAQTVAMEIVKVINQSDEIERQVAI